MSTSEQLQAENERLGAEVAALRVLLGAVSDLADVPMPADNADMQKHYYECVIRIDKIAVYAGGDIGAVRPEIRAGVLHDRAQALREHGARPLRYKARAAEPEPGRDEPCSTDAAEVLSAAIAARTPVVVTDDEPASIVGRIVVDAHDDSPCPVTGKIVGQVDEDTVEVLWGERQFEDHPGTGSYEPVDALRPALRQVSA